MQTLKEASSYLLEHVSKPVSADIKEQVHFINTRWRDMIAMAESFAKEQQLHQSRHDYNEGVTKLVEWLRRSETLVGLKVDAKSVHIQRHMEELEVNFYTLYQLYLIVSLFWAPTISQSDSFRIGYLLAHV